jgi:L-ascorbate metabolism protein UlaG (beta-lactamase superfamily)
MRAGRIARIAALLVAATTIGCDRTTPPSRIYYHGPRSSHFDGAHFFNPEGESGSGGARTKGAADFVQIGMGHEGHHDWPKSVAVTPTVPPRRIDGDAMRVTWIGHASTLVQTQGLNILIDPVWASRDSPVQFVGPKRVRAPGVRLRDLPPIDIVLISHNHYDHLDIGTLKFLDYRDHPRIITGLGNDTLLAQHGLAATARDWGDHVTIRPGIDVVLTRAHHWSAHWIDDIDRSLWTGFRITLPGGDLYYAGDTGPGDMRWAAEAKGAAPVRFAILPIAPYKLQEPPSGNHIDPHQAVAAFQTIGAGFALGVHWGTFELGPEPIDGAPAKLQGELAAGHVDPARFRTLAAGEGWDIPALPAR